MAQNTSSSIFGGRTVKECEAMIQKALQNPTVKFLREHLEKAGCLVGNNFIRAADCSSERKGYSGRYLSGEGIIVCSNAVDSQDDVNQVVIHELIHAFDDCRVANMDWTNCAHHACSEIRAGHLSGDCDYKRELLRGFIKEGHEQGYEQECIRRRVMASLQKNPFCPKVAAKDAMETVWDVCYNDTQPFGRAP